VQIIDTATNTVTTRIDDCCEPYHVAAIPGGSRAYVSHPTPTFYPTSVNVIDAATKTVIENPLYSARRSGG
jgi:DNA-binding beta-propeller fold protein YncE